MSGEQPSENQCNPSPDFQRREPGPINGKERAYDLECAQGSYPAYCPNYFDSHTQAAQEAVIDAWPNVTFELVESAWSALEGQLDGSNVDRPRPPSRYNLDFSGYYCETGETIPEYEICDD